MRHPNKRTFESWAVLILEQPPTDDIPEEVVDELRGAILPIGYCSLSEAVAETTVDPQTGEERTIPDAVSIYGRDAARNLLGQGKLIAAQWMIEQMREQDSDTLVLERRAGTVCWNADQGPDWYERPEPWRPGH